jgi:hypothetical protein
MASWLDSLFRSCCSRQKPHIEDPKRTKSTHVSQIPATEQDLHSIPTFSAMPETGDAVSCSLPQSPIISLTQISQKSTLTSQQSSTDSALFLLSQMKCGVCEEGSTGFCIGCQKRRYCFACFQSVHSSMSGLHKFISYAGITRRSRRGTEERHIL